MDEKLEIIGQILSKTTQYMQLPAPVITYTQHLPVERKLYFDHLQTVIYSVGEIFCVTRSQENVS